MHIKLKMTLPVEPALGLVEGLVLAARFAPHETRYSPKWYVKVGQVEIGVKSYEAREVTDDYLQTRNAPN